MNSVSPFTAYATTASVNFLNTIQIHRGKVVEMLQGHKDIKDWGKTMVKEKYLYPMQFERIFGENTFDILELWSFRKHCRSFLQNMNREKVVDSAFWPMLEDKISDAPLEFHLIDNRVLSAPKIGGTAGLLSLLSYELFMLKEKGILERIKKCENDDCLAFYINHSGRRKWCSMEVCGNRIKVNRHLRKTDS